MHLIVNTCIEHIFFIGFTGKIFVPGQFLETSWFPNKCVQICLDPQYQKLCASDTSVHYKSFVVKPKTRGIEVQKQGNTISLSKIQSISNSTWDRRYDFIAAKPNKVHGSCLGLTHEGDTKNNPVCVCVHLFVFTKKTWRSSTRRLVHLFLMFMHRINNVLLLSKDNQQKCKITHYPATSWEKNMVICAEWWSTLVIWIPYCWEVVCYIFRKQKCAMVCEIVLMDLMSCVKTLVLQTPWLGNIFSRWEQTQWTRIRITNFSKIVLEQTVTVNLLWCIRSVETDNTWETFPFSLLWMMFCCLRSACLQKYCRNHGHCTINNYHSNQTSITVLWKD